MGTRYFRNRNLAGCDPLALDRLSGHWRLGPLPQFARTAFGRALIVFAALSWVVGRSSAQEASAASELPSQTIAPDLSEDPYWTAFQKSLASASEKLDSPTRLKRAQFLIAGLKYFLEEAKYRSLLDRIDLLQVLEVSFAGVQQAGGDLENHIAQTLVLLKQIGLRWDPTQADRGYRWVAKALEANDRHRGQLLVRWADLVRAEFLDLDRAYRLVAEAGPCIAALEPSGFRVQCEREWVNQRILLAIALGVPDTVLDASSAALESAWTGLDAVAQGWDAPEHEGQVAAAVYAWIDASRNQIDVDLALDRFARVQAAEERIQRSEHWVRIQAVAPTPAATLELRMLIGGFLASSQGALETQDLAGWSGLERLESLAAADSPLADQPSEQSIARSALGDVRLAQGKFEEARRLYALSAEWKESSALAARQLWLERLAGTSNIREQEARRALESIWTQELQFWRTLPKSASGIAPLHFDSDMEALEELALADLEEMKTLDAVVVCLERLALQQSVGSLARRLELAAPLGTEIVDRLGAQDRLVLAYQPGKRRSFVFWWGPSGVGCSELPPYNVLDAERRMLLVSLARGEGIQAASKQAGQVFLPPALREAMADSKELWISGMDGLGYLPFELLTWNEADPIGIHFEVGYLPSLPAGVALAREARLVLPGAGFGLMACTDPGPQAQVDFPSLQPLELTSQTFVPWLEAYETLPTTVRFGSEATLAALREMLQADLRMLQVVAHGVPHPELPVGRGLALFGTRQQGGGFWPADLYQGSQAPPVVLLTACGIWDAVTRRGEDGSTHLGGAFVAAGARCVVLSWADLEVAYVPLVNAHLHQLLASGLSVQTALLRLRQEQWKRAAWNPAAIQCLSMHAFGWPSTVPFPGGVPKPWAASFGPWLVGMGLGLGAFAYLRHRRRLGR